MNKQLILFLVSIFALVTVSVLLMRPANFGDHTDCFQYQSPNKCTSMGCHWDGSMCHNVDSIIFEKQTDRLQKHSCPNTTNAELCKKYGCQFDGHICIDLD